MLIRPALSFALLVAFTFPVRADSPKDVESATNLVYFSEASLSRVKVAIAAKNPYFLDRYTKLLAASDLLLASEPDRVVNKTVVPPSGDIHDYISYAPFRWPNETKQDRLPWKANDGVVNSISRGADMDYVRLRDFSDALESLSFAYYFSGDAKYSDKGVELLKSWFVEPTTRVNPNINCVQGVPGLAEGRPAGMIEWSRISTVITAMQLLLKGGMLPAELKTPMLAWMSQYLDWLLTSQLGKEADALPDVVAYPIELPDQITATLNVDTARKTPVNHMLLGLNCNWPENLYGKVGYNHPDAQRLITNLNPSSLRFPHGVWANFYDWESDGRRITDDYKTPYDSAVKDHPDLKYGFDGLHKLHKKLNFDVLLTFNVNYDSPEKAARRLVDRRDKGFDVKWVELGNEIFWKTQRSNAVIDVEKYIEVSKAHAAALKKVSPSLQVSIPAHWRTAETNPWNLAVKEHHYYDAVTLHKHMGNKADREGTAATLDARRLMVQTGQTLRKVFPDLPIWVSEWSVGCGKQENAIGILGMSDVYLGFFEHPELFGLADYFQINASHKLIAYDKTSGAYTRTGYGAAFQTIRDVFQNGAIYDSNLESTQIGDGLNAVSAEAVIKDGELIVFAINKTNRSVPFELKIDGTLHTSQCVHRTLSFDDANATKTFELDQDVLTNVTPEAHQAVSMFILPPLSLNRIDERKRQQ